MMRYALSLRKRPTPRLRSVTVVARGFGEQGRKHRGARSGALRERRRGKTHQGRDRNRKRRGHAENRPPRDNATGANA